MNGMPFDLFLLSLLKDGNPLRIDVKFWSIVYITLQAYPIYFEESQRCLTQEGVIKEIEECVMEERMTHPQTWDEFLFWSWNQNEYECYDGYDENWRLRHDMMQYHYKMNYYFS